MLDANLILTIRLYSLIVTVNMVKFCCFPFPILLNKLVVCIVHCRHVHQRGALSSQRVEAWTWGNKTQAGRPHQEARGTQIPTAALWPSPATLP
jgi:hypothetical protein